jgi:DNA-binding protein H-NS
MAKTYSQLLQGIEALRRQAEARRKKEVAGVVGRIRKAIEFYGLTAADLGLRSGTAGVAKKARAGPASGRGAVKYSDGAGHSWSGRGPRPRWLREALANGQSLEQFQSGPAAAKKAGPGRASKGKKRARGAKFRDAAGNTWSGMGKRPQWLRDALASGKRLEDFLIDNGNGGSASAG